VRQQVEEALDMTHGIGKVLVGFDGSADAQRALAWGIEEAAGRHAPLHVVIARGDRLSSYPRPRDWVAAVTAEWVGQAQETLKQADLPTELVEVIDGSPAEVLVRASDPSTLVVLGSHGYGRISGPYLGSVSQHVARYAAGPVVVVRPAANPGSTRIVVGVDGSGGSEDALEFAFERASRSGVSLFVLYGWRSSAALTMGWGGTVPFGATVRVPENAAEEAASAELLLAETVAGLSEKYPDVEVYREAIPVPARALADASQNAAMVVVGSRGRGAFAGLLLGSVSQSVLHHAECPVAIVR
jgi:nucleotide-binding universal stress UspA family protein